MGYTIPGWLDDVLDFIGINFPNVDEDDYREMATAMRNFAEQFEGHGADAHKAFSRVLSSSEGWAVDAMEKHWNQVKGSHLEKLPELARLFADACDVLADIIFAMKTKAEIELGVMAASLGISAGLAVATGGLSALIGAGEVAAMRQIVKRIIDEAVDRIVDEVIAKITEPVNAKLEAMVEDMVLDLAEGAFHAPADSSGGHGKGHGGMQLASAGSDSASGGSNKPLVIDHLEFEDGAGKVSGHGKEMKTTTAHLDIARNAFGRSKGRDTFTSVFDPVLHGALKGAKTALHKVGEHIEETLPKHVKLASATHKAKDHHVRDQVEKVKDTPQPDGGKREVPMYLLNANGHVDRLHRDGTKTRVTGSEESLPDIVGGDGKVWRYRSTDPGTNPYPVDTQKDAKVNSRRLDPDEKTDLAEATQIARYARGDYQNGNYAAVHYTDCNGNPFILVGHSHGVHSERVIGYPVLRDGNPNGIHDLYTEREPCQESNSWCDKWLAQHFGENTEVTHSHSYDQTRDENGKMDPKKDVEHTAFKDNLKEWHRQHGLSAGMMTESDGAAMEAARKSHK
ncbi:nucleic acid/nucleotide deaminase domain-containing protein [Streptomyces sp. NPDC046831]|uniref:WXG100-like domain-containing protein n=1 Tax=Streptomyces sp. NPDC046831 TaxID=3154805 RepID=UPI00340F5068